MQQEPCWTPRAGECGERRLEHGSGEAERFYRELKQRGVPVRAGIDQATRTPLVRVLVAELEMELWIGNPAKIASQRVRKQKTDRQDANAVAATVAEGRFPRPRRARRTGTRGKPPWQRHRLVQMRGRGSDA